MKEPLIFGAVAAMVCAGAAFATDFTLYNVVPFSPGNEKVVAADAKEYLERTGACAIVKGLRAVTDFESEFQQGLANKILNEDLETMFMITNQDYMYLSSTIVREIAGFGGDVSRFVDPRINDIVMERLAKKE